MKVSRHAGHDCRCCVSCYSGVLRIVQTQGVDSDNSLEFLVGQLVDCHDFGQLLSIPHLVLHKVWNTDVLHLSQCFQSVHIFK